jgi:serine/threonine-protein kinase
MSPEQAQGRRVDARSDIFSFGVLMYEMVTGQKAFSQDSTISTIASILRDEVRPMSDAAAGVPAELEEIIGRGMRKDPADRWQSMDEVFMMLAALKQKFDSGILAHTQMVPLKPPPSAKTGAKKPNKLVPFIAAAAAAAAAAGGGGWWWTSHKRAQERAAAEAAAANQAAATIPVPVGALPTPAPIEPAPPPNSVPPGVLTNDGIISMVQAKLSTGQIINQIRSSETKFDMSVTEVIRLAKEGVPDPVINAMRNPKAIAAPPTPTPTKSPTASSTAPTANAPVVTPSPAVSIPPPVSQPVAVAPPPTVTAPPPSPTASAPVVLHEIPIVGGTPFSIVLLADVPAGVEPGTALKFQVLQDVKANGSVVIRQGAPVTGEIVGAGRKVVVFGGKTQFKLNSVTSVDGKGLHIKASPGRSGDKNQQSIEPPGRKNKEILAPAGQQYQAYFDGDQSVAVKK